MCKEKAIIFLIIIFSFFCRTTFSQDNNEELADIWFQIGVQFYDIGYYQDAVNRFKTCLSFNPDHKGAKKYLDLIGQLQEKEIANTSQNQETGSILKKESVEKIEKVAERYTVLDVAAEKIEKVQKQAKVIREKLIDKALNDVTIEMSLEYQFAYGEQSFDIINSSGQTISRLKFPNKHGVGIINAELKLHPKFSIGGRYGSSIFRKKNVCSDEDWYLPLFYYQITRQESKPRVNFFDLNLYCRILDLDKSQMKKISNFFLLDRFCLDVFGGYQQYKGRYTMGDPMIDWFLQDYAGFWWSVAGLPADVGLDSFYKIKYKGPRVGVRLRGWANDKFSSKLSFSYAFIETRAYGWWNLRTYHFWQNGDDGSAYNIDAEVTYNLTPNWFIGIGYHYMKHRQGKLLESGDLLLPVPDTYTDEDIVRDADNAIHGPTLRVGCMW